MVGSYNDGDSTTTNLYIGNVNPTVNENDLCDVFAAFGPLASVKIMWPRTDEERARNRNSGFVAYMNRQDAETALKSLTGINIKGYDIKLGWAKQAPIPAVPIALPDPIKIEKAQALMARIISTNNNYDSKSHNLIAPKLASQPNSMRKLSSQEADRNKGKLDNKDKDQLAKLLSELNTRRKPIGQCMLFCINHSDAANDVIEQIYESIVVSENNIRQSDDSIDNVSQLNKFNQILAKVYVISDILHNCSAQVTNASFYRVGFKTKLNKIFAHVAEQLLKISDPNILDSMKEKLLTIFKAWKDWTLFEESFIFYLSSIALGIKKLDEEDGCQNYSIIRHTCDLDGEQMTLQDFQQCLKSKDLDLQWYKSLGLSIDNLVDTKITSECDDLKESQEAVGGFDVVDFATKITKPKKDTEEWKAKRAAFKTTKWDTIDPDEVAEQVVTRSKWTSCFVSSDDAKRKFEEGADSLDDTGIDQCDTTTGSNKKLKSDCLEEGEIEGEESEEETEEAG